MQSIVWYRIVIIQKAVNDEVKASSSGSRRGGPGKELWLVLSNPGEVLLQCYNEKIPPNSRRRTKGRECFSIPTG